MLLSIVILSYNRPQEIKRILDNLKGYKYEDIDLIVKDDSSPMQDEIENVVNAYKPLINFNISFYSNKTNLGYDKNLIDAFNITESEYVFLLSDDDFLDGKILFSLIEQLSKRKYKVYFSPYNFNGVINRCSISNFELNNLHHVIYNSILFSGLIFERKTVLSLNIDSKFLSNCIYSQVYLASKIIYNQAEYGFAPKGLLYVGGDGENFFGKNESAKHKHILYDRNIITANLNYHKFLFTVVEKIALETNIIILDLFKKEYKKRLISYGLIARSKGITVYRDFFKGYKDKVIVKSRFTSFALIVLFILPKFSAYKFYIVIKSIFKRSG